MVCGGGGGGGNHCQNVYSLDLIQIFLRFTKYWQSDVMCVCAKLLCVCVCPSIGNKYNWVTQIFIFNFLEKVDAAIKLFYSFYRCVNVERNIVDTATIMKWNLACDHTMTQCI